MNVVEPRDPNLSAIRIYGRPRDSQREASCDYGLNCPPPTTLLFQAPGVSASRDYVAAACATDKPSK